MICLLLALFFGTSVLGHELSGKTLTYLFTRPLPRWKFVVGKYLGIISALILPASLSLLASWLILGAEGGLNAAAGLLVATTGALLAYTAIFILAGFLIPRRAMIIAILYAVVFELILSFMPALVNRLTVTYYLRSLVAEMLEIPIPHEVARIIGGASPQASLIALLAITLFALAISSLLAAHKEYVIHDQA
ncbi:MAG: ABC transporter permease subunit [Planctomycetota bacterium]